MSIDAIALEAARKKLSSGVFDTQAYITQYIAERRLGVLECGKQCTNCKSVDSFEARFADYVESRGNDEAEEKLNNCLAIGVSTFSELYHNCESDSERESIKEACLRISEMVK